jgi:23S rRNA pseudouridine1911/1915/1917 synthase
LVAHRFVVGDPDAGTRLDQFLATRDLPLSRSQLKRHIDEGHVLVGGQAAKPSRKLRSGDEVAFDEPPPQPTAIVAEDLQLVVVFEDPYLIAIDKPAGLVVHPAAGHRSGTLVNALLHHCDDLSGIGGELRPGIVHRLDRDTTGVMVATKDDVTHVAMAALFKKKDLLRLYHAIVSPAPREDSGTIKTFYGRHPKDRKKFTSRTGEGKRAVTHFTVKERFAAVSPSAADAALVECRLETGRTHQIRVHMAEHGWPLLGDAVYGKRPDDEPLRSLAEQLGRQALHASVLAFKHPRTGATIDLRRPVPDDMQRVIDALREIRPTPPAKATPAASPRRR